MRPRRAPWCPAPLLLLALVAACGADQDTRPAVTVISNPPHLPARTAAESRDLRALATDVVASRICGELRDSFRALRPSGDPAAPGPPPITGRLWFEHCRARRLPGGIEVQVEARGWRWLDHEVAQLGARFALDQYVRFTADFESHVAADVAYDQDHHLLYLWLTPTEPIRVAIEPTGDIDVRRPETWSALLGWAADTLPLESLEARARRRISHTSSARLAMQLASGYTLVLDLCTGVRQSRLGAVPEGRRPAPPAPDRAPAPRPGTSVRLYPGGIDVAGPFRAGARPLVAEIEVREGRGVDARMICLADATKVVDAFLTGAPLPDVPALARARARPDRPASLRATAGCELAILTRSIDPSEPVPYQLRVPHAGPREEHGLLSCPRPDPR